MVAQHEKQIADLKELYDQKTKEGQTKLEVGRRLVHVD